MGKTTFELSWVVDKCKSCKRYVGVLPGFNLCYTCLDVKKQQITKKEAERKLKTVEQLRKEQTMEVDWNWKRPW